VPDARAPDSGSLAPPWARTVAIVAVVIAGAVGGLAWHPRRPSRVDAWADELLAVSRDSFPYRFASLVDDTVRTLGVLAWTVAIALTAWVLLRRWDAVVAATVVAPATVAIETLIKYAGRRSLAVETFGYPSGRTALATSLVLLLVLILRAAAVRSQIRTVVAVAGILYALLMAWARVATSQHSFTEVVGGVSVGVAVALAVVLVLTGLRQRTAGPGDSARLPEAG
jgi:membrane-associated phospholipid phosphatase